MTAAVAPPLLAQLATWSRPGTLGRLGEPEGPRREPMPSRSRSRRAPRARRAVRHYAQRSGSAHVAIYPPGTCRRL